MPDTLFFIKSPLCKREVLEMAVVDIKNTAAQIRNMTPIKLMSLGLEQKNVDDCLKYLERCEARCKKGYIGTALGRITGLNYIIHDSLFYREIPTMRNLFKIEHRCTMILEDPVYTNKFLRDRGITLTHSERESLNIFWNNNPQGIIKFV